MKNNKYIILSVVIFVIFAAIISFHKDSETSSQISQSDTVDTNIVSTDTLESNNSEVPDSINNDSTAIGNIMFGENKAVFEKQKRVFLSEHSSLGGLKINKIKGFFYKNRLAAVQIISENNLNCEYTRWSNLYNMKYGQDYSKERKRVRVNDNNANNYFATTYEDVLNYEFENRKHLLFPPYQTKFENQIFAQVAARQVLEALGDENLLRQYEHDIQEANSRRSGDNIMLYAGETYRIAEHYYKRFYNQAAEKARIFNEKHKNAPSYSILIIIYNDLLNEYKNKKEQDIDNKKQNEKQDIEII